MSLSSLSYTSSTWFGPCAALPLPTPFFSLRYRRPPTSTPFPTRRSSDLHAASVVRAFGGAGRLEADGAGQLAVDAADALRSEEHTSELQSRQYLVCRLLLEKKKKSRRTSAPPSSGRGLTQWAARSGGRCS